MRSLVAEDDATNRTLLQRVLSKYGSCDVAGDGLEALQAVASARQKKQSYDLICVDLHMPKMDGHETIRAIRQQEAAAGVLRTAKIIVITALSDMESITQALLGKCNFYLIKPIDTAKLRTELKEFGLIS